MAKSRIITDPLTGQRLTFLQTAADSEGRSLRAEVRLEPEGFVPRHVHLRQHERLEVLTGSVRLRTRGDNRVLGPGDSAEVRRRRLHAVANLGPGEATFIIAVRPALHMEQMMRAIFAAGRALRPLARLRRRSRD